MSENFDNTINWDEYWESADETDVSDASPSAEYIADPMREFFERRGVPDSYADVGCGAGAAVFDVAARHPETSVVGYDAVPAVLSENRHRARSEGFDNVSFQRAVLPEFEPERQFEVVSSFFTLCYVADVQEALKRLYDAVEPGGYLLITYHNSNAQTMFQEMAASPHEYLDESGPWHPDTFAERFELVIEGESLLSYRTIQDVLGAWPQSVWSVAEEAEPYGAWRMNPLVFVPK